MQLFKIKDLSILHISYGLQVWVKCTVNVVSQCPGGGGGAGRRGKIWCKHIYSLYLFHMPHTTAKFACVSNYEIYIYVC